MTEKKNAKAPRSHLYKCFDKLCTDCDKNLSQLASLAGMAPQTLYAKLQRGKMTYEEISKLAGLLGYDFHYSFTPKKTSEGLNFTDEKE